MRYPSRPRKTVQREDQEKDLLLLLRCISEEVKVGSMGLLFAPVEDLTAPPFDVSAVSKLAVTTQLDCQDTFCQRIIVSLSLHFQR
jgi:hypothetical protein